MLKIKQDADKNMTHMLYSHLSDTYKSIESRQRKTTTRKNKVILMIA